MVGGRGRQRGGGRLEELRKLFDKHGLRPNRKLGQNFLLDKNAVRAIARDAGVNPLDLVLEIGPGSGLLTSIIAHAGAKVLAVEIDSGMFELVTAQAEEWPEVEVIHADILAGKHDIEPTVLDRIDTYIKATPDRHLKCVSNLPYCIASPFLANLCEDPRPWDCAVVLVQLEEAERLASGPNTRAYGNLSIVASLAGKATILRTLPPAVFWPRPKVQSAVLRIDFHPPEVRCAIPWKALRRLTVSVFSARRKKLRNAVQGLFGKGDKERARAFLEAADLDPDVRGGTLTPQQFRHAAEVLVQMESKS